LGTGNITRFETRENQEVYMGKKRGREKGNRLSAALGKGESARWSPETRGRRSESQEKRRSSAKQRRKRWLFQMKQRKKEKIWANRTKKY